MTAELKTRGEAIQLREGYIKAHYSSLTLHRKCPQAWYYKYGLLIQEPEDRIAPKRDLGSWWSAIRAAEALERGRALGSLLQEPRTFKSPGKHKFDMKTVTVEEVLAAAAAWWKGHSKMLDADGVVAAETWEKELNITDLHEGLDLLLHRHLDMWGEEIKNEEPLGVEVFWERQLPQPKDSWVPGGYPEMWLIGYVDEITRDKRRNQIIARDHKSTGKLEAATTLDDMMDSQLQLYAWGADPLVRSWTGNDGIKGVAYDRAKSIAPKPPQLTLAGKLRVSGGEPAVGMMDLQTYLDWVESKPEFKGTKKDGSGAGVYELEENVVEKLSTSAARANWFQRTQVPLNRNLIKTHLRAAVDSSLDIYRTRLRAEETHEAQRNLSNGCKFCAYAKICRTQMIGGPDGTYDLAQFGLEGRNGEKVLDEGALV